MRWWGSVRSLSPGTGAAVSACRHGCRLLGSTPEHLGHPAPAAENLDPAGSALHLSGDRSDGPGVFGMGLALGVVTGTILSFEFGLLWPGFMAAFGNVFGLGFMLEGFSFVAAVGIILRGASYALRGQLDGAPRRRLIEDVFALSSVLTPFALGTVVGGIASGRVPVGNAQGDLFASWLNPTSVLTGALAVGTSSYLAAVYLAADARRVGERTLELDFRARALWTGVVAGALAIGGLAVVRFDAEPIWRGLTSGTGLAMVSVSVAAGLVTLMLVWRSRFGPARVSAALAVAAIVAGWAFAQHDTHRRRDRRCRGCDHPRSVADPALRPVRPRSPGHWGRRRPTHSGRAEYRHGSTPAAPGRSIPPRVPLRWRPVDDLGPIRLGSRRRHRLPLRVRGIRLRPRRHDPRRTA